MAYCKAPPRRDFYRKINKLGANEKCFCGSGIKYKKCCKHLVDEYYCSSNNISADLEFILIKLTHRLLFQKYDNTYLKEISTIPIITIIDWVSYLDIKLNEFSDFDKRFVVDSIHGLFENQVLTKVKIICDLRDNVAFLHQALILNLFKFSLIYSPVQEELPQSDTLKYKIGKILLKLNDYPESEPNNFKSLNMDPKVFIEQFTIMDSMNRSVDNPRLFLLRYKILFLDIPKTLTAHPEYIDFQQLFFNTFGLTLQQYIAFNFGLYSVFRTYKHIDETTFFSNTGIKPATGQKFFDLVRLDYEKYKSAVSKELDFQSDITYRNVTPQKYPLIKVFNKTYCISRRYLLQKGSGNLYWLFFDKANERYGCISKFTTYFGELFQSYIAKLLSKINFKRYKIGLRARNSKKQGHKPEIDLLIYDETNIAVVEIKTSRLNRNILETGNIELFKKDLGKTYEDAIDQIAKIFKCIFNNEFELPIAMSKVKYFYPITLFLEPLPQEIFINQYYREIVERHELLNIAANIRFPTIMDSLEFEYSLKLLEENAFFSVLEDRLNDSILKEKSLALHQNLWVTCGSGRAPKV